MTIIESIFFLAAHNTHSVSSLRALGFTAKECGKGFIEAHPNDKIQKLEMVLEKGRDLTPQEESSLGESRKKLLIGELISGQRPDSPPLMEFHFDGDDEICLIKHLEDGVTSTIWNAAFIEETIDIKAHLKDIYSIDNVFTDIGFARYTAHDLYSEEQKSKIASLKADVESMHYNAWLSNTGFANLSEIEKLSFVLNLHNKEREKKQVKSSEVPAFRQLDFLERYIQENQ